MLPLYLRCVCSAISWSQHFPGQNPEALECDCEGNAGLNKRQTSWDLRERPAKIRYSTSRGRG